MAQTANHSFRLPLQLDPARLAADTERCLRSPWVKHVNQQVYRGEWTSIALRSSSGGAADILSVPDAEGYRDTPLLAECPYFRDVVASFACEKESIRLLRLAAGSVIHEHRDPGSSYSDGFFRLHVPITTNDEVRFVVGGVRLMMKPGECWYADFGLPHSVENPGTTDRIHLVIDGRRNPWSDGLFARAGYDFEADARARAMDPETRRRVVEALRERGTDIDLKLAAELEAGA